MITATPTPGHLAKNVEKVQSGRTEQQVRYDRLVRLTADARRRGRDRITVKTRDLEILVGIAVAHEAAGNAT